MFRSAVEIPFSIFDGTLELFGLEIFCNDSDVTYVWGKIRIFVTPDGSNGPIEPTRTDQLDYRINTRLFSYQ